MKPLMITAAVAIALGLAAVPGLAATHNDNGFFSVGLDSQSWSWNGNQAALAWDQAEQQVQRTATATSNQFQQTAAMTQQELDEGAFDDAEDTGTSDDGEDSDRFETTSNRFQTTSNRFQTTSNRFQTTSQQTGGQANDLLYVQGSQQDLQRFDGLVVLTNGQNVQDFAPISLDLNNREMNQSQQFDTRILLIDLTDRFSTTQRTQSRDAPVIRQGQVAPTGNAYDYSENERINDTNNSNFQQTSNPVDDNGAPVYTGTANDSWTVGGDDQREDEQGWGGIGDDDAAEQGSEWWDTSTWNS